MSKTVPFDILLNFIIGMLAALAWREGLREHQSLAINRYLLGVVLFELFFFIPLGAYLYFFFPDWSLMYFVNPAALAESTREAVGGLALLAYMAAIVGGFLLAADLVRKDRDGTAMLILLIAAVALGVFSALTLARLMGVGTYAEFTALPRTTVPLWAHRVGYITGVYGAAATIALAALLRNLQRRMA
ncbi:MAG TPA: hypothetical protein VM658_00995 [bacterium]|nr:hypothetical protein [bacterium]